MSRRSRRRISQRGGEPYYRSRRSLPPADISPDAVGGGYFVGEADDPPVPSVFRPLAIYLPPVPQKTARALTVSPSSSSSSWEKLRIEVPERVRFCVQRAQRKQVLFAARIAGTSGIGRGKAWRRTANSAWRC